MFLDIRDFTTYTERAEPEEVVALLNGFWELVVPAVVRHRGHANKFIGDGLLAVFGAPERLADHAQRAVAAALEIGQLVRRRYAGRLGVGIGVNSGPVVAGTVGGGGRVEFAVIGDTVNTASRVEAATREVGDDVLITDATRELAGDELFAFEPRTSVTLKGKRDPVTLWAPRLATPDLAPIRGESGDLALPNAPMESPPPIPPTGDLALPHAPMESPHSSSPTGDLALPDAPMESTQSISPARTIPR
jgi:class 3 adenylate cyclase